MAELASVVDKVTAAMQRRHSDGWDGHWVDVLRFALPYDTSFDRLNSSGLSLLTATMGAGPQIRSRTKDVYDYTSVWAIERLTNGLMTMKAPETTRWHDLVIEDMFGAEEASHAERAWLDDVASYLFRIRNNPKTGFWIALKAAVRSMCALGDGFIFVNENFGDDRKPTTYEFVPIGECYHSVDTQGNTLSFARVRGLSAEQIVARWGIDKVGEKIRMAFNNPGTRHSQFTVVHSVMPREADLRGGRLGLMSAKLESRFFILDGVSSINLETSGYWNMPYHRLPWSRSSFAYSEGPMALALAEVKSLNEMSKNELIASQQAVRPPLAVFGENFGPINLNAGAINRGYVNGDGRSLVQPIVTQTRPDFAQAVIESRRSGVREMLYLNLWQILVDRPEMTATEALLRAQEKGDLLGPVGVSMNIGLASMTEHEIAILARKGMFEKGRPLEAPESLFDRDVVPQFTAPLDRLRLVDAAVGAQRVVQAMLEIAPAKPDIMDNLDADAYARTLRDSFGAPFDLLRSPDDVKKEREGREQAMQLAQAADIAQKGGAAAQAVGAGMQAMRGQATGSAPAVAAA